MRGKHLPVQEIGVAGIVLAILMTLLAPESHWRENISQSCHLCGNRHIIHRNVRWWRFASETFEPVTAFPIPPGHQHDWWTYSRTFVSWSRKWASDQGSMYRDGRLTWDGKSAPPKK